MKFVAWTSIKTLQDIEKKIPKWDFRVDYAADVLEELKGVDNEWQERIDKEKAKKLAKQEKERAEKKTLREQQKEIKAAEHRAEEEQKRAQWTILTPETQPIASTFSSQASNLFVFSGFIFSFSTCWQFFCSPTTPHYSQACSQDHTIIL